jgi:hypothetical protein
VPQERNWSSNLFEAIFGLAPKITVKAIPVMQMPTSIIHVESQMEEAALIASSRFLHAVASLRQYGIIAERCHRYRHHR